MAKPAHMAAETAPAPRPPAHEPHPSGRPEWLLRPLDAALGGPARRRVVLLLASVLALESADFGAVGAMATELKRSLGMGDAELGLLVTAVAFVGAVATIPAGVLVDRAHRVHLLAGSVALWALAMAASGLAGSFTTLLLTRLAPGAVTATAGPAIASLTGDLFPPGERANVWSQILTGQLVGAGVGFLAAGNAAALSWRAGFWLLALPALILAVALWRLLPEPARGGGSRLAPGATRIVPGDEESGPATDEPPSVEDVEGERDLVQAQVEEADVPPDPEIVVTEDVERMSLWRAVRYVLRVRTNLALIVASGLGYFFLGGLQTFAVEYLRGRYGLGQSAASSLVIGIGIGALGGVLVSGRLADGLLRRGYVSARLVVPAVAFIAAAAFLLPGFLATSFLVAAPLLALGVAGLAAPNPPLDAARLDVIPGWLWGRAEGVRTLLRGVLVAFAPLTFGVLSEAFGEGTGGFGASGPSAVATHGGRALADTFLLMLGCLVLAGVALLVARPSYPTDVASAAATERRTERPAERRPVTTGDVSAA